MSKFYIGDGSEIDIVTSSEVSGEKYDILKNKKWLLFGDSITQGGSYWQPISTTYNMQIIEGGFAGGRAMAYANGTENCVLEHLNDIDTDIIPDVITIALGTNDYNGPTSGAPIGTLADDPDTQTSQNYTFIGCYKKLLKWCWSNYGKTPIVLMTPFPRNSIGVTNIAGKTLADYAQAIRDIGEYYSYPVCDCFGDVGLPIGSLTDYSSSTWLYTSDGLHLIPGTGKYTSPLLMQKMAEAMETIIVHCTSAGQSATSYTLTNTSPKRIYVTLQPPGCTDRVTWESSNDNIVIADQNVNHIYCDLNAVSNGSATVTATIGDGTITKTFDITVAL